MNDLKGDIQLKGCKILWDEILDSCIHLKGECDIGKCTCSRRIKTARKGMNDVQEIHSRIHQPGKYTHTHTHTHSLEVL